MKKVLAELITIGEEILSGQITDTNSRWMSAELEAVGITVIRKTSVGIRKMKSSTRCGSRKEGRYYSHHGRLGPTSDDRTKPCLARYFDCELKIHEEALAEVTEFFVSRGRELTEVNRQQAALPVCCTKITNPIGTAPGMWFEKKDTTGGKERVFVFHARRAIRDEKDHDRKCNPEVVENLPGTNHRTSGFSHRGHRRVFPGRDNFFMGKITANPY